MALFAFFGIWETLLAAGIGVSVPVVIHLLNRRRYRIVTWAAMRFLLAAQRQNTKRMRIEQLLLLLVRAALILLIILAMASIMPWAERLWAMFIPGGGPLKGPGVRVHHLIVLDASLSMNVGGEDGTVFDFARQMALKKIKETSPGDGFSVLLMKENPAWIVGETSYDARKVAREVEETSATHGNASLPTTLNMIAAKLAENANRFPAQAVYFFTDMQKATWANVPRSEPGGEEMQLRDLDDILKAARRTGKDNVLAEIGKRAKVVFVDAGRDGVGNLAVTKLDIQDPYLDVESPFVTTGMEVKIPFAVRNFDTKEKKNLRIELLVGRAKEKADDPTLSLRVVDQKLESLAPGDILNRTFIHRFTQPGTYAVRVQIEHDSLPVDDARTIIATVKETIPLLLVNGKTSPDRFDQATEYLRIALNPYPKGQEKKDAPLRPTVVSSAQFDAMSESELLGFDGLYFCDVGQVSAPALRRLNTFLRLGGGVVFSVGDQVADNLEAYNRLLYSNGQGLLPAKLKQRAQDQFTIQAPNPAEDFKVAPLKVFQDDDDRIALHSSRFRQYLVAELPADAKVRTILNYMREEMATDKSEARSAPTNNPALLEWHPPLPKLEQTDGRPTPKGPIVPLRYRGNVLLFTSTLNMDWNIWPGSPSYGAMMQEVARLAVSGKLRGHAQVVGGTLEEFFPSGGLDLDVQVVPPNPLASTDANAPAMKPKKIKTQSQGEVSIFRWAETDIAGIYTLTAPNDPREHLFAVNVPVGTADSRDSESDLTRLDGEHLKDLYPGWDMQVVNDPSKIQMTFAPPRPPSNDEGEEPPPVLGVVGPMVAQWLLYGVLFLLILEVVLAWRFGHYSVVAGANEPPAIGKALPITIAIVGGLVFVFVAFTLFDAHRTGDAFGYLFDSWRGWFERLLGVPPAPPGEGTRWELETRPFLRDSGSDFWPVVGIALASLFLIFHIYREEGPLVSKLYKALLGAMRLSLILLTLFVLLPQLKLRFDRQGWPDVVMIIDDSRSMGEADSFLDEQVRERAAKLREQVRSVIQEKMPARIEALKAELAPKVAKAKKNKDEMNEDPFLNLEIERLEERLRTWEFQLSQTNEKLYPSWQPTRLQLVQALLAQPSPERDWLNYLVNDRHTKVHIYHLDAQGRAIKLTSAQDGSIGEITEADPRQLELAHQGVADLQAEGMDSRLGSAVRHVIDHYRGAALSAVIFFTDGITTRDETILQTSEYAAQKGVPLYFVGIGDDHEVRDLRLHDLQVDDVVYVNDMVNFEARLTGHGYKDLTVPVILKVKDKNGKEKELSRIKIKVDEQGKSVRVKLQHQPTEVGRKHYIIEVEASKKDAEKPLSTGNLRLERAIDVMDSKVIKVLLVDGTARYEYRFLKALLEREIQDEKKHRSIELKVVLQDADAEFASSDKSALSDFPATREELSAYDVIILGDANPDKLRMQNLADFVRGEDAKGRKTSKTGGGLLFVAGTRFNPHSYKGTPLADVMPVEPIGKRPVDPEEYTERYYLDLTPVGKQHNIFRFTNDDNENQDIWRRKLDKLYWWSTGYRIKPLAEVLAVHPTKKAAFQEPGQDPRQPLVVQQFVGSGRTMFFGFDESWRWRFREHEVRYNKFWIQTIRYLSRNRLLRTDLRLDRQTPYRVGEMIKVTVRFPDNTPLPGKEDPKQPAAPFQVKVNVEYQPKSKDATPEPVKTMTLSKQEGMTIFEGYLGPVREGKYRFWLSSPDVSKLQPDGEKPGAEAVVELPPGELDKLRLNRRELMQAAEATMGGFYTLATADKLLEDLPTSNRVSLSTPRPPVILWSNLVVFLIVLGLLTGEWILRKRKHLL